MTAQYRQRPIRKVDKIRLEQYHPEGQTALYDSIAGILKALPGQETQRQIVVILTDGEDVCSWTSLTECADAIASAQANGVLVVFLGDGPDALMTADLLGIPVSCRYLFTARDGLQKVFTALTTQTLKSLEHVATRGMLPASFFAEKG